VSVVSAEGFVGRGEQLAVLDDAYRAAHARLRAATAAVTAGVRAAAHRLRLYDTDTPA
jgi:hypothetical protein